MQMKERFFMLLILIVLFGFMIYFLNSSQKEEMIEIVPSVELEENETIFEELENCEVELTIEEVKQDNVEQESFQTVDIEIIEEETKLDLRLEPEFIDPKNETVVHLKKLQEMKENTASVLNVEEKEDPTEWSVDYSVELEEGSLEEIQQGNIKGEMFKGSIGFQKSF